MKTTPQSFGYFHITLSPQGAHPLLTSNGERAFIISQLQDLLSPRLVIGDLPAYRQLASCIDLLAFSIQRSSIQFVVFSIDEALARYFTETICTHLADFQTTYHYRLKVEINTVIKRLRGPHQALARTVTLHTAHQDWEYDRYSSIGFYLHDRRGDWIRIWRMTSLYDQDPEQYRSLLLHKQPVDTVTATLQTRVA